MSLLNLPEFTEIEHYQENETDMLFKVERNTPPSYCPQCGFDKLYKHDNRTRLIMDLPIRTKRVGIKVYQKRYKCLNCNSTFWEHLSEVHHKRNMTIRLVEHIEKQSLIKKYVEVAEDVGVTEKTVRNIFNDYVAIKESEHVFYTPRWLGMDEIYILGKPRFIMTNIEERTIFDIRENRKKELVIQRLMQLTDRHSIEYVTMDMWRPYKEAVNQCLPEARIIVDKFHVVRMANDAIERVRKSIRKNVSTKERRALMHDRKILLKRFHELDEMGKVLLQVWLDAYPELKEAHHLKESFYGIWDATDSYDGKERFSKWLSEVAESKVQSAFIDCAKAVTNWRDEIFTYFDKRLTNAYTESFNSLIREMNRGGRGYNYESLRAKLLFNENLHKGRKPRFDKESFYYLMGTGNEISDSYGVDFSTLSDFLEKGML